MRDNFTNLNIGDKIYLNEIIFTARDRAHLYLLEYNLNKLENSIIYHCGPLIKDNQVIAAGPTTSSRMNPYTPKLIEKYHIRAIIGKGGMDKDVLEAMKGRCVYFSAIGGAALVYAEAMKIKNVYKKEFGMPEAIWEFEVKNFPVIVTMDSKGNSLHQEVLEKSNKKLFKIKKP